MFKENVIGEIVLSEEDCLKMAEKEKEYKSKVGQWKEVIEKEYWEMLDILPPIWFGSGFFMREALYADFHDFYIKKENKYYKAVFSRNNTWGEIKDSLESFIKEEEE